MDIPILYEDKDVLIINKPAGLSVHGDGLSEEYTLVNWILEKYPEIRDVGEGMVSQSGKIILRPGIVHRLDKDTSGVLLIAKTQETFLFLKKAFQDHQIKKTYEALVYGTPLLNEGEIDFPISRSKADPRRRVALAKKSHQVGKKIRTAITEYKVLSRGKEASHVLLFPRTGRTHQLRVHMRAIGHPIVADSLYAPLKPTLFGLSRQALHAKEIQLTLASGKNISLVAPLPSDMEKAITLFYQTV